MNKKIAIIILVLLTASMLATPVFAEKPNKVSVSAKDLKTLGQSYDPLTYRWVTNGDISHLVYIKVWGTLNLYVGGQVIPVSWVDEIRGVYNMKTMEGVWLWDEVWTLPGGTFEGTAHVRTVGGNIITWQEWYSEIILHGTGDYEGQVMSLSMERLARSDPAIYEGYWLTP